MRKKHAFKGATHVGTMGFIVKILFAVKNSQGIFQSFANVSVSHCLPSPPMFPEEELGDILFRDRVHRVGAALNF